MAELKSELKTRGLKVSGKKADLVARLVEAHDSSQILEDGTKQKILSEEDGNHEKYEDKTVAQLKVILRSKKLPVGGKKTDLIERLSRYTNNSMEIQQQKHQIKAKKSPSVRVDDYKTKTVTQLKSLLREKGLKIGGRKAELIDRLMTSVSDIN